MKTRVSCIVLTMYSLYGFSQNIGVNTTGASPAVTNLFEVLQPSTTANTVGVYVNHSGAVAGSSGYALQAIKDGASLNNIAAYLSASGATNNYALIVPSGGGNVGIGTTTPTEQLQITNNFRFPATTGSTVGVILMGANRFIHAYGTNNTFLGISTGNFTLTGARNTGVGANALQGLTSGVDNVALGNQSLVSMASGSNNVAIGAGAGQNATGSANVAIGAGAFVHNTGNSSVAIGRYALEGVSGSSTASINVAIGSEAARKLTTGSQNTAVGTSAAKEITTGDRNTAIGNSALLSITTANDNVAIGHEALRSNTVTDNLLAIGYRALFANTTGTANLAIGYGALRTNTIGSQNLAIGVNSLQVLTDGDSNTGVGVGTVGKLTTGDQNTALGSQSLNDNIVGNNNTAIGYRTLYLTTGSNNTALGNQAGDNITTGSSNIIIGNSIDAPSATADNQLNIGNTIYGNLSTGNVGIGTSVPSSKLHTSSGAANTVPIETVQNTAGDYQTFVTTANPNSVITGSIGDVATDVTNGVYYFKTSGAATNTGWSAFNGTGAVNWSLTGNAGTTPGTHFVGTTDAQDFAVYTNNTERMRVLSGGNVGIGTTAPNTKLDVVGNIFHFGSDNVSQTTRTDATVKNMYFALPHYTNAEEKMFLIGGQSTSTGNDIYIGNSFTATANTATSIRFATASNNTTLTGTERVRIDLNGNVGIGTTAPLSKLGVSGNVIIGTFLAAPVTGSQLYVGDKEMSTNAGIGTPHKNIQVTASNANEIAQINVGVFDGSRNSQAGFFVYDQNFWGLAHTYSSGGNLPFIIHTNGSEKLRLDINGNVGIGTTAPVYKLDVNGGIRSNTGEIISRVDGSSAIFQSISFRDAGNPQKY